MCSEVKTFMDVACVAALLGRGEGIWGEEGDWGLGKGKGEPARKPYVFVSVRSPEAVNSDWSNMKGD